MMISDAMPDTGDEEAGGGDSGDSRFLMRFPSAAVVVVVVDDDDDSLSTSPLHRHLHRHRRRRREISPIAGVVDRAGIVAASVLLTMIRAFPRLCACSSARVRTRARRQPPYTPGADGTMPVPRIVPPPRTSSTWLLLLRRWHHQYPRWRTCSTHRRYSRASTEAATEHTRRIRHR